MLMINSTMLNFLNREQYNRSASENSTTTYNGKCPPPPEKEVLASSHPPAASGEKLILSGGTQTWIQCNRAAAKPAKSIVHNQQLAGHLVLGLTE
jgi:hypothetical protein